MLLLGGCMARYEPPWAPYPVNVTQSGDAAAECRTQAEDQNMPVSEGVRGVAIGAGAGAALGTVIAAIASGGAFGVAAGWGALAGGGAGAMIGVAHGLDKQGSAIDACLKRHGQPAAQQPSSG